MDEERMNIQLQLVDEMSFEQVTMPVTKPQLEVIKKISRLIPHHLQIITQQ